jgi:hypothetical protein
MAVPLQLRLVIERVLVRAVEVLLMRGAIERARRFLVHWRGIGVRKRRRVEHPVRSLVRRMCRVRPLVMIP